MSYSKCLGMGDPITSPSQVPSDLDLMWLNLDGGANPTTSTTTSGGLTTTSFPVSTTADGTTVVQLLPLVVVGAVAYFLFRKK